MRYGFLTVVVALLVQGCATSKAIEGPNGKTAYFIKCGSAVIEKCYEEAASVCPNGYSMVDKDANGNVFLAPAGTGLMAVRGPNTMLVECK